MTALPTDADLTGDTLTESQFKTGLTTLRAYLAGLLGTEGTVAAALAILGQPYRAVQAATGGTTLSAADRGKLVSATGTWTLTLPLASTAGAGWMAGLVNRGTGTITVDPAGSDQVNGASTATFGPGRFAALVCDGTGWVAVGLPDDVLPFQASADDTTAGRLLRVGAGGMLATAGVTATDYNAATVGGVHYYVVANATNGPPDWSTDAGPAAIYVLPSQNASNLTQIAAQLNVAGRLAVRHQRAGVWGAWKQLSTHDDVAVGTSALILDGAVGTFTPPRTGGRAFLSVNATATSPRAEFSGELWYNVSAAPDCLKLSSAIGASLTAISPGVALTGSEGSAGHIVVSAYGGLIYVANRTGVDNRTVLLDWNGASRA